MSYDSIKSVYLAFPKVQFIDDSIWLTVASLVANLALDEQAPEHLRQEIRYFAEDNFLVLSIANGRSSGGFILVDEMALVSSVLGRIFDSVPDEVLQLYWYGSVDDFVTLKTWTFQFQKCLRNCLRSTHTG